VSLDKDNDLRCRINKRAKAKFGIGASEEKTAYIEREFGKRRDRRESKQRILAFKRDEFPRFTITPKLLHDLFSTHGSRITDDIRTAGTLLIDTLRGVRSGGKFQASNDAAGAFKHMLKDESFNNIAFVDAMKYMARNAELMDVVKSKINADGSKVNDDGSDEELYGGSGDDKPAPKEPLSQTSASTRTASTEFGADGSASSPTHHPDDLADAAPTTTPFALSQSALLLSQQRIRSLASASALLTEMAAGHKPYQSPYENPRPSKAPPPIKATAPSISAVSNEAPKLNGIPEDAFTEPLSIDKAADHLLALAQGSGSSDEDDDDETIEDTNERNGGDFPDVPPVDSCLSASIRQFCYQQIADARARPNPQAEQVLREQASKLDSYILEAGLPINTIVASAEASALSQLYLKLSSYIRTAPQPDPRQLPPPRSYSSPFQAPPQLPPKPENSYQPRPGHYQPQLSQHPPPPMPPMQHMQMMPLHMPPMQMAPLQTPPMNMIPLHQMPPMQMPPMQMPPMQMPPMQMPPMQMPPMQMPPMQMRPMQMRPMHIPPMQLAPMHMMPMHMQPMPMHLMHPMHPMPPMQMQLVQMPPFPPQHLQQAPVLLPSPNSLDEERKINKYGFPPMPGT
jgi:hypothetical protein